MPQEGKSIILRQKEDKRIGAHPSLNFGGGLGSLAKMFGNPFPQITQVRVRSFFLFQRCVAMHLGHVCSSHFRTDLIVMVFLSRALEKTLGTADGLESQISDRRLLSTFAEYFQQYLKRQLYPAPSITLEKDSPHLFLFHSPKSNLKIKPRIRKEI